MPLSTDNQDFTPNDANLDQKKEKPSDIETGPALGNLPLGNDVGSEDASFDKSAQESSNEDENNFDSDNQKGKKIDADPTKESDQPAELNQS
ncbi:MAG: hypothetical protein LH478_15280 [Chitinophagaceae bacterium]|nr:hypothetical protein [Chitinophagaceae bacterium]